MEIDADGRDYFFTFVFKFSGKTGQYPLNFDSSVHYPFYSAAVYTGYISDTLRGLQYTTKSVGYVNVTYSSDSIISGTFSFDLSDSISVVHFTNGEFDIGPR